jgi:hypothetical protein
VGTLEYSLRRCWVDVIAERTERRLTRDLMLEAVPWGRQLCAHSFSQPKCERRFTHKLFSQHLRSARDLVLGRCASSAESPCALCRQGRARTDNERDHAGAVTAGGFEALDQLLDLPYLNVLLGVVGLRLLRRHGRGGGCGVCVKS